MNTTQISEIARQRLAEIGPGSEEINTWRTYLASYRASAQYPDDAFASLTCILALAAVKKGNFGVGSILIDQSGTVISQGHNEVFHPYFRSDRHAEMVVMDEFEDANPDFEKPGDYTLYTSLEPCPMCLVRLSASNVKKVVFVAQDADGGMVHKITDLPVFWVELLQTRVCRQASCSPGLVDAAQQIFLLNLAELNAKIRAQ